MRVKLSAEVTGLDEDMAAIEQRFAAALTGALPALKDEMAQCLAEHVQKDVYDRFTPTEYQRRGDDGGLADIEGNAAFTVGEDSVAMDYQPSGESEQVENPLNGDALIGRIEHLNPEYDWTRKPPARPFFENFVTELIEGGRAEETLVRAMNARDGGLFIEANGYAGRDGDEGY